MKQRWILLSYNDACECHSYPVDHHDDDDDDDVMEEL
jgi:hypothetical protein